MSYCWRSQNVSMIRTWPPGASAAAARCNMLAMAGSLKQLRNWLIQIRSMAGGSGALASSMSTACSCARSRTPAADRFCSAIAN
ncbi:hypothetical protein D9M71_833590 [compost metagenome]